MLHAAYNPAMQLSRAAVIFLGAGLGGVLRYLLAAAIQGRAAGNFPQGSRPWTTPDECW